MFQISMQKRLEVVSLDFDKIYKHYDTFMKFTGAYKIEQIENILELQGNEILLDIGGGTGYVATQLSKHCKKIYVLDESQKMLSMMKPSDNVIPVIGDALDLSVIDDNIDIVILTDVLHHIKEQEKLIAEIHRKLNKKGKLLILEFNKNHYKTKVLRLFECLLFRKLYFLSTDQVKALIQNEFCVTRFTDYKYYFIILGEKIHNPNRRII